MIATERTDERTMPANTNSSRRTNKLTLQLSPIAAGEQYIAAAAATTDIWPIQLKHLRTNE